MGLRFRASLVLVAALVSGCGGHAARADRASEMRRDSIDVRADSATFRMPVASGEVSAGTEPTAVRIAPARGLPPPPLPRAEPAAIDEGPRVVSEGLPHDDALRPPILREPARLEVAGTRAGEVEMELRVDENGEVSDAQCVAVPEDRELARDAIRAVMASRWYPATREGRAVAVWCRQRVTVRAR